MAKIKRHIFNEKGSLSISISIVTQTPPPTKLNWNVTTQTAQGITTWQRRGKMYRDVNRPRIRTMN